MICISDKYHIIGFVNNTLDKDEIRIFARTPQLVEEFINEITKSQRCGDCKFLDRGWCDSLQGCMNPDFGGCADFEPREIKE